MQLYKITAERKQSDNLNIIEEISADVVVWRQLIGGLKKSDKVMGGLSLVL
ncbi:hypothetical protein [Sulfuriferula sp. AH1]|uniref:hypothetical protein n=1 Tax=Sulfuriferula sp. AH1 TaxID=1985873 RepID=UPI0012F97F5F|nr:hypothetical protein [Sulfuriferula sp. AH1]